MAMSVVNRVRFTAWAWLASAFLVGLAAGVVMAGIPLWNRLQAAKSEVARLEQVEQLTRLVAPGSDAETLASLEEPPRADVPSARSAVTGIPKPSSAEPSAVVAQEVREVQVLKVNASSAEAELSAPQAAPVSAPAPAPPAAGPPPAAPAATPPRSTDAERKAAEAKKAAQIAEEAERKAKAERLAKADREQKQAKAAQEAKLKLEREREQAEARAAALAATRAKPATEASPRPEPVVRLAPPVPAAGTNAPTERVTKDEAGVADIQASGVTFRSGRRVAVGDSFPSGEKLISVDPGIGEIITSKRRIVIKAAAPLQ
jgi:hypothetical protein